VELYGHALVEVAKGRLGLFEMFVTIFGALAGAAFYLTVNKWLEEQGLPLLKPVDRGPQWQHIVDGTNGRPDALYLSNKAVLKYPYKLVAGEQQYSIYTGQLFPNCSTISDLATKGPVVPLLDEVQLFGQLLDLGLPKETVNAVMDIHDCGDGQLFNVEADPSETTDLSTDPKYSDVFEELKQALAGFNKGIFSPDRGNVTMDACWSAMKTGGYYGPYVDTDSFYTPVTLTPKQKENNKVAKKDLKYVEKVLLPNRTLQVEWFTSRVGIGNLSDLLQGDAFDKCLQPQFEVTV